MEVLIRIAAAGLLGSVTALLLKRRAPELSVPLSAAVCAFGIFAAAGLLGDVLDLLREAMALSGLSELYFLPVLKCVALGLVSKTAADLCRDAGQSAMAGAVELGGAVAALFVALPLLRSLLDLLRALL
ncbi:MAG: stage III sporulation AC/AD family protein [Oscillospiraceae bacterium]|nr:stage III sporulation AC/AD family protein [Oscillospiraceae bacterium]